MKILHVVPTYLPAVRYGGPIYSVHGLCRSLVRTGQEVHVFTTNVDGSLDSQVPLEKPVDLDGVKVWYFSSAFLRRVYYSAAMKKALSENISSFQLVHNHSVFLWPTWEAARQARRKGIPYLISPRGMLVKELIRRKSAGVKGAWISLIEKKSLENASGIHLTSEEEKKELLRFNFKLPPLFVVPNGVDMPSELAETSPSASKLVRNVASGNYILFLGRINWKKGLDRLVEAMKHIPEQVRLVIAGNDEENYQRNIEKLAEGLGVLPRIDFIGPVYGQDKRMLYENAKCFALPSFSENFGNTVIEAMASGCPVVVTSQVGLSALVRQSEAGVVTEGDPAILGKAIAGLIADKETCMRMGKSGRVAATAFSWKNVSAEMTAIYQGLVSHAK